MSTWHEDYWRGGNPLERENFTVMTFRDPPPKLLEDVLMVVLSPELPPEPDDPEPPRSALWLVFWFMVSCSLWGGIGWVLGRMW